MKVLFIHKFWYLRGGAERYLFNLAELLSQYGHKVVPFACAHPKNVKSKFSHLFPTYYDLGSVHFDYRSLKAALNFFYNKEARKKLNLLLKQFKPDVAHCRNIYHHLSSSVLWELKLQQIPTIMTVADYKLICPARTLFNNHLCTECEKGSYYKALLKRCIKNSITASLLCVMEAYFHNLFKIYEKTIDVFVTPSAFARKKLITHGFPAYKVIHIPHFINLNIYKPEYKSGDYLIYFGRLSPEKGLITLLEAVRVLPQIKLLLVGDGPMRTKLERICKFKKIVNVEFRRHIYNVLHLHELIRNAMCSILPSEWPEVFGLQILESFALGKPVIASDIGGIKELVSNNSSGFLFKPGDKEDLKNKILMLYKNKEHVSVMGKTARAYVEEKHDAKAHYYTLMKLYESLIKA